MTAPETITFYLCLTVLICVVQMFPARATWQKKLRVALFLFAAIFPLAVERQLGLVVIDIALMLFLALETWYPRNPVSRASEESYLDIANTTLARALYLALSFYWLNQLDMGSIPWGLEAHQVSGWAQGIIVFVVLDFYHYVRHWAFHRFPLLWRIHAIHHSGKELTALTASRSHILEFVVMRRVVPTFLAYGMGVRASVFFWSYLVLGGIIGQWYAHSNLNFPKTRAWWACLLTSPNLHGHHHSRLRPGKNFGVNLLIWDHLFGTFELPPEKVEDFGFDGDDFAERGLVRQNLHSFGL